MHPDLYYEDIFLGLGVGFATLLITLYAIALLFAIAQYVTNGIAMLRIAKKAGVPNGWMAFVPFADIYLLGKVANVNSVKKNHVKRLMVTYCIYFALMLVYIFAAVVYGFAAADGDYLFFGSLLFCGSAILFVAVAIVFDVFFYMAIYRLCENFGGSSGIGYFLGILLGSLFCSSLVHVILLLILSFKTPAVTDAPTVTVEEPIAQDSVF